MGVVSEEIWISLFFLGFLSTDRFPLTGFSLTLFTASLSFCNKTYLIMDGFMKKLRLDTMTGKRNDNFLGFFILSDSTT